MSVWARGPVFGAEAAIDVTQGPPGTVVQAIGRCPGDLVHVSIYHVVAPGDAPYDAWNTTKPAESDGTWSMAFTISLDMPPGPAGFSVLCSTGDAFIPGRDFDSWSPTQKCCPSHPSLALEREHLDLPGGHAQLSICRCD